MTCMQRASLPMRSVGKFVRCGPSYLLCTYPLGSVVCGAHHYRIVVVACPPMWPGLLILVHDLVMWLALALLPPSDSTEFSMKKLVPLPCRHDYSVCIVYSQTIGLMWPHPIPFRIDWYAVGAAGVAKKWRARRGPL